MLIAIEWTAAGIVFRDNVERMGENNSGCCLPFSRFTSFTNRHFCLGPASAFESLVYQLLSNASLACWSSSPSAALFLAFDQLSARQYRAVHSSVLLTPVLRHPSCFCVWLESANYVQHRFVLVELFPADYTCLGRRPALHVVVVLECTHSLLQNLLHRDPLLFTSLISSGRVRFTLFLELGSPCMSASSSFPVAFSCDSSSACSGSLFASSSGGWVRRHVISIYMRQRLFGLQWYVDDFSEFLLGPSFAHWFVARSVWTQLRDQFWQGARWWGRSFLVPPQISMCLSALELVFLNHFQTSGRWASTISPAIFSDGLKRKMSRAAWRMMHLIRTLSTMCRYYVPSCKVASVVSTCPRD